MSERAIPRVDHFAGVLRYVTTRARYFPSPFKMVTLAVNFKKCDHQDGFRIIMTFQNALHTYLRHYRIGCEIGRVMALPSAAIFDS